jgi:hypothetical protein
LVGQEQVTLIRHEIKAPKIKTRGAEVESQPKLTFPVAAVVQLVRKEEVGRSGTGGAQLQLAVAVGCKCTDIAAPEESLKKTLVVKIVEYLG